MKRATTKRKKFFTFPIQIITVGVCLSVYGVIGGMIYYGCNFEQLVLVSCINDSGNRLDDRVIAGYIIAGVGAFIQLFVLALQVHIKIANWIEKRS